MTRLLLIGASGLDWRSFDRLSRSGALSNMAGLGHRGVAGWLSGSPSNSRAAWASMITGRQPEAHGIYRDQEAWVGGLRPVGRASWLASPIWARLAQAGISTGGVAWPSIRPGAAWAGAHVDEDFAEATGRNGADWALPLRCAPGDVRDALGARRVHPTDITAAMLRPLAPDLIDIDQSRDAGLPLLAIAMARAATIQAAAAWMLTERRPDALFVHQPWLGQVRANFDAHHDGPYAEAVAGAWRFLDGLIGRLAELAGPDTLLMLASPGWNSKPGVLLAAGPGVQAGVEFRGAGFLDVAPTILGRIGLEDASLPGRRVAALETATEYVPAPEPDPVAPAESDPELLRVAVDAGYPPPRPPPAQWRAQGLAELAMLVLARAPRPASELGHAALEADPNNVLALRVRAMALVALDEPEPLADLADALEQAAPSRGWGALARGAYHALRGQTSLAAQWRVKAEADTEPEALLNVATVWLAASRSASAERVFRAILARDPGHVSAEIGLSMTAMARRDFASAEAALQRARDQDPGRATIYLQLAQLYARTARPAQAERMADIAQRMGAAEALADAARHGQLSD
jgi:hypothetical protein